MTETVETHAAGGPAPAEVPTAAELTPAQAAESAQTAKSKRKRSRSLRDLQKMERRLSKAALRMSRAVHEGVVTYIRERDLSAERIRDGALLEMPVNAAKGLSAAIAKGSRVPVDVARAVDTRTARRAIRLGAKLLLWPLRR